MRISLRAVVPSASVISGRFFSGAPDRALVDLPSDVAAGVDIYRNVMSPNTQLKLYDEIAHVLDKQGQKTYVTGNSEQKVVRNVCVDLHGYEHVKTMKNWDRMSDQRVYGLVWSPTLVEFVQTTAKNIMGFEADTARLVEHQAPGYEMHVEHPSYGTTFALLNLMSPTVWAFDNEADGRRGAMYLPERSFARISGEPRWGWRIGQNFDEASLYFNPLKKLVPHDGLNISIWLCKFDPKLVDKRGLSEKIESSVERLASSQTSDGALGASPSSGGGGGGALAGNSANGGGLSGGFGAAGGNSRQSVGPAPVAAAVPGEDAGATLERAARLAREKKEEEAFARDALEGAGVLGGDMVGKAPSVGGAAASGKRKTPQSVEEGTKHLHGYKQDLGKLGAVMSKVTTKAEKGDSMTDDWLKGELNAALGDSKKADREFDPDTDLGDWGDIEEKATHYKTKLKEMNFEAEPTSAAVRKNVAKAKAASEAFAGAVEVEVFDPVSAAKSVRDMHASMQGRGKR